jgi:hypothetical protein
MTPIDRAHAQMEAAPESDAARLRFYECLADIELSLLLDDAPDGDNIRPRLFPVDGQDMVMVFDTEERLAEFAGEAAHFVALPGRDVARMLAGLGYGLGLNLGVAPSGIVLPPEALDWLCETLDNRAEEVDDAPLELFPPEVAADFLTALEGKLGAAAGLADSAYIAATNYADGRRASLLVFVGAHELAEAALTQAVTDAVSFSAEPIDLDIAFVDAGDELLIELAAIGRSFDMHLADPVTAPPRAPGSDPDRPPRLR